MPFSPDELREALRRHAADVAPDESLDPMRGLPERLRAMRRARILTSVVTAAAVLVLTLLVPEAVDAPRRPATTAPSPAGVQSAVPVYYLNGDRLARELRQLGGPADRVGAAVEAMLTTPALDPDYRTGWPAGAVATVTRTADGYAVDVSAPPADGCAAVQQLVHTVTAAAGRTVPVTVRVRGRSSGAVPGLARCVDPRGRSERAPQRDVLVGVQVSSPNEGDRVPRRFELIGHSRVTTGSLSWAVTDAGTGAVLARGAPAALGDSPGGWTIDVEVPAPAAGSTVVVTVSGQQPDGTTAADTKQVRVAD